MNKTSMFICQFLQTKTFCLNKQKLFENSVHKLREQIRKKCSQATPIELHSKMPLRQNVFGIQMLPEILHRQIFKECYTNGWTSPIEDKQPKISECLDTLKSFELVTKQSGQLKHVEFELPLLKGNNIEQHFHTIALEQSKEYLTLINDIVNNKLPPMPTASDWENTPGWTKYEPLSSSSFSVTQVDTPEEHGLVFDCEVLASKTDLPVMAVAVSSKAWYSWTSKHVEDDVPQHNDLDSLVPLENLEDRRCKQAKLIIGHNVSYDRARTREQYYPEMFSNVRFMDTMSMHVATSGFNSQQRLIFKSNSANLKNNLSLKDSWLDSGTMNSLDAIHKFYCGSHLDKSSRDVFLKGTMQEIRDKFKKLMHYCAMDVAATHKVLTKLVPLFFDRFPHPVTFAGMLEMGQMYLPVNRNWNRYTRSCQDVYSNLDHELKSHLAMLADDCCHLVEHELYKQDKWLWNIDWTSSKLKLLKKPRSGWKAPVKFQGRLENLTKIEHSFVEENKISLGLALDDISCVQSSSIDELYRTGCFLPKIESHKPGYPKWYAELCLKESNDDWRQGKMLISTLTRITPKLLRLKWLGNPLHFIDVYGWGYLVPKHSELKFVEESSKSFFDELDNPVYKNKALSSHTCAEAVHVDGGYTFHKLPHKDGIGNNVGNPLSQAFLPHIESGELSSTDASDAQRCLEINKICSYWRSAQKRILNQMVVSLSNSCLPMNVLCHTDFIPNTLGAIIPGVAVNGTISRRAVEQTWLTASNIQTDRIGSELKAMVQAPPGQCFVGADVDSQELWIASLLGDSGSIGEHGCTPLSWMTLQGNKRDGTDLHSKTAKAVGSTRNQAKIFNYARMYGGGKQAALRTLMQHNPGLSKSEAIKKVTTLFNMTKGEVSYKISEEGHWFINKTNLRLQWANVDLKTCKYSEVLKLKKAAETAFGNVRQVNFNELVTGTFWVNGMESHMFNKLEEIATSAHPKTPVLGCRLTQTLEPSKVKDQFLLSRMNWVVQSSAVDYLHLLLVAMRWLIKEKNLKARFVLSIHDEVRYLADEEHQNNAALALQISNLLTRCMFAYKHNMHDLPFSVAFFSLIEIDKVLRKEATEDCVTPSNPFGLKKKYGIPLGVSLDIYDILEKTNGRFK